MTQDMIDTELKIYGNTNRIADSGLPNGAQIFAIGDSHTIFFHNSMRVKEHWGFMNRIPLTMYTFLQSNLNLYTIGATLGTGHEEYEIKAGDYVLFFYGYNDVQKNINIYGKEKWRSEIARIVSEYIKLLASFRETYKITPIATCCYPNPLPKAEGQVANGSYSQRREYAEYMNDFMGKICKIMKIPFFDIYKEITDEHGFIKAGITKDFIHLDHGNTDIRNIVENRILDLCING